VGQQVGAVAEISPKYDVSSAVRLPDDSVRAGQESTQFSPSHV